MFYEITQGLKFTTPYEEVTMAVNLSSPKSLHSSAQNLAIWDDFHTTTPPHFSKMVGMGSTIEYCIWNSTHKPYQLGNNNRRLSCRFFFFLAPPISFFGWAAVCFNWWSESFPQMQNFACVVKIIHEGPQAIFHMIRPLSHNMMMWVELELGKEGERLYYLPNHKL